MKRIVLVLALTLGAGLTLLSSSARADGLHAKARAVARSGQVTGIGRGAVVVPRSFFPGAFLPFGVVPGPATAAPVVVNIVVGPGEPPDGSHREAPPPPVQPKMIDVKPGLSRGWCWDKTTWSWVPACP